MRSLCAVRCRLPEITALTLVGCFGALICWLYRRRVRAAKASKPTVTGTTAVSSAAAALEVKEEEEEEDFFHWSPARHGRRFPSPQRIAQFVPHLQLQCLLHALSSNSPRLSMCICTSILPHLPVSLVRVTSPSRARSRIDWPGVDSSPVSIGRIRQAFDRVQRGEQNRNRLRMHMQQEEEE